MSGLVRLFGLALYLCALVLAIWFLLFLFDASSGNQVVHWFHQAADWLSGWTHGLFDAVHNSKLHALLVFGVPALVYGAVGNVLGRTGGRA
jgi:hypothetical protein